MSKALSTKVMKVLSLFTGVQMFSIICSIVKMKIVALWLGATGVGLFGIYQSVLETVTTISDLGLRSSAVRDVSRSRAIPSRLARIAYIVRRWSVIAGLLGAVIMMGAAPFLGRWFFGSYSGCWGFILLALSLFANALCGGEQAIMQGSERFKALVWANMWGSITGLVCSIPLFYYLGDKGVVLSILIYSLTLLLFIAAKRVRTAAVMPRPGLRQIWHEGGTFVRLGLCMALASFVTSTAHSIFIGVLNEISSTAEVGYVQAGDTVLLRYVGLLFTAVSMEFYPRLATSLPGHPKRVALFVNHEVLLITMLLTPLILLFLLLREPIILLLYKSDFLVIIPFISLGIVSSIPKALSWCMAYTIIAKGDGKTFLLTESLDALISLPVCLLAYRYYGLTGLGAAYILWYVLYALIVGVVYYRRYGLRLSANVWRVSLLSLLTVSVALLAVNSLPMAASIPSLLALALLWIPPLRRMFASRH